jgi:hypothetical protein
MTKKIEKVAKGNYYETKDKVLIVVTNGRLKDEGELGQSFEGKTVTYDPNKQKPIEAKKTDRFYLDELVRRLLKKDLEEWVAVEQRESEAAVDADAEPKPAPAKQAKPKKTKDKLSGLDAAAKVLGEAGGPMKCQDMVDQMLSKGYWQTNGATPAATIYAAIVREIRDKGDISRFRKVERGSFELNQ